MTEIFFAVLYCDSSTQINDYSPNINRFSSLYFCQLTVGAFGVIVLAFIAYLYKSTMYYSNEQISSGFDKRILIIKMIFSLTFAIYRNSNELFLMLSLFSVSLYITYYYNNTQPHWNGQIKQMYRVTTALFLWTNSILLIGKFLTPMSFNGSLPLWMLGDLLIVLIVLFFSYNRLPIILTSILHIKQSYEMIKFILEFNEIILSLTDNNSKSHSNTIILLSYLKKYEEKCKVPNCPIEKYLNNTEQNNNGIVYLYQHIEILFEESIARFPNCPQLRRSYAEYLIQFNKKSNAIRELITANALNPSFEEEFMIYKNQQSLEDIDLIQNPTCLNTLFKNPKAKYDYKQQDSVSIQLYKIKYSLFRTNLIKLANYYNDFWSMLLDNHDIKEQLDKLNQLGSKINESINNINKEYEELRQINGNDHKVLFYYSEFLSKILNDKDKANKYKMKFISLEESKDHDVDQEDMNLTNLDNYSLLVDDEQMFIVLSSNKLTFCSIINVSLSTCAYFGYLKEDLIGKNINVLLPYLLLDDHNKMLQIKLDNFQKKKEMNQIEHNAGKSKTKVINSFGINKAKYLIEIKVKTSMVPLDNHEYVFIGRFEKTNLKSNNNLLLDPNANSQICHILVDKNFYIHNFTSNVLSLLGMKASTIQNNVEITSLIKEFNEEFLKRAVEIESLTSEQKVLIKKEIIEKHYRNKESVTMRKRDFDLSMKRSRMSVFQETLDPVEDNNKATSSIRLLSNNCKPDALMLCVKDFSILNKHLGYLFQFELWFRKLNLNYTRKSISGAKEVPRKSKILNFVLSGIGILADESNNEMYLNDNRDFQNEITLLHSKVDDKRLFQLDPNKMSYVMDQSLNQTDMRERLKKIALNKLNYINANTVKTSKSIGSESNDGESSSYDDSDSNNNDDNDNNNDDEFSSQYSKSEEEPNRSKESNNNKEISKLAIDTFYRVNMSNIKYSIYNYKKKTIIANDNYEKITQVDYKLKNDNQKEKSGDVPNDKTQSTKLGTNESLSVPSTIVTKEKGTTLIKYIKQALAKEDTQPSIQALKIFTNIGFILIIANAGIWLIDITITNNQIKQLFYFIQGSSNLLYLSLHSLFNVQELILLNHPNYTSFYYSRERDNKILCTINNNNYFLTHQIISNLSSSIGSLDKATQNKFNTTFCNLKQLNQEDYSILNYNLSIFSALSQANTALYHIINDGMAMLPTNQLVFFYRYNSLNDLLNTQMNLIQDYSDSFFSYLNFISIIFIVLFVIAIPFLVFIYFTVTRAFSIVIGRKESYLEAFFQIGENVIRRALEKCERFLIKIQSDNINKALFIEGDDYDEDNSYQQETRGSAELSRNDVDKLKGNGKSLIKKSKNSTSKDTKWIKIFLLSFSLGVLSINSIILAFNNKFVQLVNNYTQDYNTKNKLQITMMLLVIDHREFFFDSNQMVNHTDVLTHLDQTRLSYYTQSAKSEVTKTFPLSYTTAQKDIYSSKMCSLLVSIPPGNAFPDLFNCASIFYNAIDYGLDIVKETFMMELRSLLYSKILREKMYYKPLNFEYNLTLFKTSLDVNAPPLGSNSSIAELYYELNPMTLLNDNQRYKNIKSGYVFVIQPSFLFLFDKFTQSINEVIKNNLLMMYIALIAYLSLTLFMFIIVWKPYENKLKNVIYKTKNMLSIIPIDVLASFDKIQQLLNIKLESNGVAKGDLKLKVT